MNVSYKTLHFCICNFAISPLGYWIVNILSSIPQLPQSFLVSGFQYLLLFRVLRSLIQCWDILIVYSILPIRIGFVRLLKRSICLVFPFRVDCGDWWAINGCQLLWWHLCILLLEPKSPSMTWSEHVSELQYQAINCMSQSLHRSQAPTTSIHKRHPAS